MQEKESIVISDAARKQVVASVRRYFAENCDDEIGELKAILVLDYFLAELGR